MQSIHLIVCNTNQLSEKERKKIEIEGGGGKRVGWRRTSRSSLTGFLKGEACELEGSFLGKRGVIDHVENAGEVRMRKQIKLLSMSYNSSLILLKVDLVVMGGDDGDDDDDGEKMRD